MAGTVLPRAGTVLVGQSRPPRQREVLRPEDHFVRTRAMSMNKSSAGAGDQFAHGIKATEVVQWLNRSHERHGNYRHVRVGVLDELGQFRLPRPGHGMVLWTIES